MNPNRAVSTAPETGLGLHMDRNASASVMSSHGRRGLFRDIEPFSFGWLNTDGRTRSITRSAARRAASRR
jgi:hypothetical protein